MIEYPRLIEFSQIGKPEFGFLSVAEVEKNIPFGIKRVFWSYSVPPNVKRGRHAHFETEMVLIGVAGVVKVETECIDGKTHSFLLDKPNRGVFLPKLCWHEMKYSQNAVQLVLASTLYSEEDYIREYKVFDELKK